MPGDTALASWARAHTSTLRRGVASWAEPAKGRPSDEAPDRWHIEVGAEPLWVLDAPTGTSAWSISSVAWTPAGADEFLLAAGGDSHTVWVWDPASGDRLVTLREHSGRINSLAWGTSPDGQLLLAVACGDGTVRIWDLAAEELLRTLADLAPYTYSYARTVAWGSARDGRLLLATPGLANDVGHTARIWDPFTGECVATLADHRRPVISVTWSAAQDGPSLLATASADTVRVWDPATWACLHTLTGEGLDIEAVALGTGPDGQPVLAMTDHNDAQVWDPLTETCLHTLTNHSYVVHAADLTTTPDGQSLLATASFDGSVRIWNAGTAEELAVLEHQTDVNTVAFTVAAAGPAGERSLLLATGCDDAKVRVYQVALGAPKPGRPPRRPASAVASAVPDIPRGVLAPVGPLEVSQDPVQVLAGHSEETWPVAWWRTAEGRLLLASGGRGGTVKVWDPGTGDCLKTLTGHTAHVRSLAWTTTDDGISWLATCSDDRTARIWDITTGECLLSLRDHNGWVLSVSWARGPSGEYLLATSTDHAQVKVWDVNTGECLSTLVAGGEMVPWASMPGGQLLLATAGRPVEGSHGNTAQVWDPLSGECLHTLSGHTNFIRALAWASTPDENLVLATGGQDRTVRVWDPAAGTCLRTLTGHADSVPSLAWTTTPGNRLLLATAGFDKAVRIWDPATGEELAAIRHPDIVCSIAFAPASATGPHGEPSLLLATSSNDTQVRIYRLALPQEPGVGSDQRANDVAAEDVPQAARPSLTVAVTGLLALGDRNLWPPLGLLHDLVTITGSHPGGELNDPSLAGLVTHPRMTAMRALDWPTPARMALAAVVTAEYPHHPGYRPPGTHDAPELTAALADSLAVPTDGPALPVMAASDVKARLDSLHPNTLALLTILGYDAAANDPTLPLRLMHAAPHLPPLSPHTMTLLTAETRLLRTANSSRVPIMHPTEHTTTTHHGQPTHLIPTHQALPPNIRTFQHLTGQLIYRHYTRPRSHTPGPRTLVLDTTPPTYGPVEAQLRLLTHLLTVALWTNASHPTLVTSTHPRTPQPLTGRHQLPYIWTTRTLTSPDLRTPLATAESLDQPIILLTHHHTATAQQVYPTERVTLVTTHTPGTPSPPIPTHPCHHHVPPDPASTQLTSLIAMLLSADSDS